jgi:hypothetical protein
VKSGGASLKRRYQYYATAGGFSDEKHKLLRTPFEDMSQNITLKRQRAKTPIFSPNFRTLKRTP